MKLATATDCTYCEAKIVASQAHLDEAGMPRWSFEYPGGKRDAEPDVLVLGTYVHPTSGNKLVGGINLHYINEVQLQELQQHLPEIMRGPNLKYRYQIGKQLLPQIFDNFYRTYKSDLISGVQPDELDTWEPEQGPMPPPARPRQPVPPPTPAPGMPGMQPLGRQPLGRAPAPAPVPQPAPGGLGPPPPQQPRPGPRRPSPGPVAQPAPGGMMTRDQLSQYQPAQPAPADPNQMDLQTLAQAYKDRMAQMQQQQAAVDAQQAKQQAIQNLRKERQKNLTQLMQPSPEPGDPLEPPMRQGRLESIEYYSPTQHRYITEEIEL